ncbi:MAG: hypothetical protein ACI8P0_004981 [Planctomycetaceae bacterium]
MTNTMRLIAVVAVLLCLASCSGESDSASTENGHAVQSRGPRTVDQSVESEQSAHDSHGEQGHVARDHNRHPSGGHSETSHSGHGNHSEHGSEPVHVKQPSDATHSKHGHTAHATPKDGHGKDGHGADHAADKGRSESGKTTPTAEAVDPLSAEFARADAATIFARRILPILKADSSSSCTECHFAGVELRDFILDDQAKTFASLKSTGMIDVDRPDESKILRFIGRKPEQSNPLIAKVRENELVAFRSWIRAAVREPELLKATSDVEVGTSLPPEVIRHARRDRVLSSFIDNIWSEMGRCINCHHPERNRQKIGRNGFTEEDVDAISWIVPNDPAATLRELVDSGNIDTDDPSASPVLAKPAGLEEHGGGPKFFPGSQTYHNFLTFLTDYADVTNRKYKSADDLPLPSEEITLLSEQQLRITDIPAAFSDMPLQVDIYRRIPRTGKWSEHRWATGFSRVNGKKNIWQNPIMVAAPTDSPLAKEFRNRKLLPTGEYRIRILIDRSRKTEKDPTYKLGDAEFVGEVEFNGAWKPGYQPPKVVTFPKLTTARAEVGHNRHQHAANAPNQVASKHRRQHKKPDRHGSWGGCLYRYPPQDAEMSRFCSQSLW